MTYILVGYFEACANGSELVNVVVRGEFAL